MIPGLIKRQGRTLIFLRADHPPPDEVCPVLVRFRAENEQTVQTCNMDDWLAWAEEQRRIESQTPDMFGGAQ